MQKYERSKWQWLQKLHFNITSLLLNKFTPQHKTNDWFHNLLQALYSYVNWELHTLRRIYLYKTTALVKDMLYHLNQNRIFGQYVYLESSRYPDLINTWLKIVIIIQVPPIAKHRHGFCEYTVYMHLNNSCGCVRIITWGLLFGIYFVQPTDFSHLFMVPTCLCKYTRKSPSFIYKHWQFSSKCFPVNLFTHGVKFNANSFLVYKKWQFFFFMDLYKMNFNLNRWNVHHFK